MNLPGQPEILESPGGSLQVDYCVVVKVTAHLAKEVQVCTESFIFRANDGPVQSLRLPHFIINRQSRLSGRATSAAECVADRYV